MLHPKGTALSGRPKALPAGVRDHPRASDGNKRGKGRGSFIGDTCEQAFDFYRDILQVLKPWQHRAPKLRKEDDREIPEQPAPVPAGSAPDAAAWTSDGLAR